jgi:membrane protease YdiL (CAAX protease family)
MSGTLMDTNPLPSVAPPPATPESSAPTATPGTAPLLTTSAPPESRLRTLGMAVVHWIVYLAMAGVVGAILVVFLRVVYPSSGSVWSSIRGEIVLMLAAILPGFVMARIEERPFGDFGLPARSAFGRNFWVGTFWGIASLSVLILGLRLAGAFEFGSLAIHGVRLLKFALFYAVFFLFTGFFEEFLLRGYSQWVLSKGLHFWPAAALLSAGFGALHSGNQGEGKVGLVAAGLIGFFFCLTLRRTGNLWWAVGFHMSWDWAESYLYSVPDSGEISPGHLLNSSFHGPTWLSGGSVGPEGSVLVFVVIAALWILFDRMYPDVKYGASSSSRHA